jgi:hypothetical protein
LFHVYRVGYRMPASIGLSWPSVECRRIVETQPEPLRTSPSGAHPSQMLFALKSPLLRYAFRYRFENDGCARGTSRSRTSFAERYAQWKIVGPPETTIGRPVMKFSPWSKLPPRPAAHRPPDDEPPPDHGPTPDPPPVEQPPPIEDLLERFLVLLFLRRYVAYCERRQRWSAAWAASTVGSPTE